MRELAIALAVVLLAGAAQAHEPGRFTIAPAGDDFIRLDTATGATSICKRKQDDSSEWRCDAVTDDHLALQREIDRLKRENRDLRDRLAKLKAAPPAPEDVPGEGEDRLDIPEAEINQVVGFVEKLIQRFQDMVRDFKRRQAEQEL